MPASAKDTFLSTGDLAERYDIPARTVEDWRLRKTGPPSHKIGRHVRYRLSDVIAWEAEHQQNAAVTA